MKGVGVAEVDGFVSEGCICARARYSPAMIGPRGFGSEHYHERATCSSRLVRRQWLTSLASRPATVSEVVGVISRATAADLLLVIAIRRIREAT